MNGAGIRMWLSAHCHSAIKNALCLLAGLGIFA